MKSAFTFFVELWLWFKLLITKVLVDNVYKDIKSAEKYSRKRNIKYKVDKRDFMLKENFCNGKVLHKLKTV